MRIAFLTIATNKYSSFVKNLYDSLQKYKNNINIELICFSNNITNSQFQTVPITHVPFPLISMMRYHYYSSQSSLLSYYDYLYHIDCDMEIMSNLDDAFIGDNVCVIHPSYYSNNLSNLSFPYDRNPNSQAYVPQGVGNRYYQNCFQGGSSKNFLTMCDVLQKRTEHDLRNNYIALWHDESYMNRYMVENPPTIELPPTYAQPEGWQSYGETKILHRSKNHNDIRSI